MHGSTERKTALVTGAAGVLGLAISKALLAKGLRVIMTDMDQARLDTLAAELGGDVFGVACNLTNPQEVENAVARITERAGIVDVLVNNAGILSNNKTAFTTPEEWRKVMDVNVNGIFYITKALVPGMKKKHWGRIINLSSLAAKSGGITAGTAYSTSKGAIISLTFSLAAELAADGITVNGIAPAYIRTPMVTAQLSDEQRAAVLAKIPVGRFCEPEECAYVVCFLADELAGFLTGEIIDQNGGLHFD